jgi:hypothetical protein
VQFFVSFLFARFPLLPLRVGVMANSLLHSRGRPGGDTRPQSRILDKSSNANTTNLCKMQSTTNSFGVEPHIMSVSTLLRFLVNCLHQTDRSR